MKDLITINNDGQPVASSRDIAEHFEKEHRNVLRDIDDLRKDVLNFEQMFFSVEIPDSYGRPQRAYLMNRDGFSLLVMGFTGKSALEWKLKYIDAFNRMEAQIKKSAVVSGGTASCTSTAHGGAGTPSQGSGKSRGTQ